MKGKAYAFAALTALAALLFVAVNAAALLVKGGEDVLERVAFTGDAAAAEDFELRSLTVVSGHYTLDSALNPATGGCGTRPGWSAAYVNPLAEPDGPELNIYQGSFDDARAAAEISEAPAPLAELYAELLAEYEATGESRKVTVPADELGEYLPLWFSAWNIAGHEPLEDGSAAIGLPVPEDLSVRIIVGPDGGGGTVCRAITEGADYSIQSSSLWAPDGWLYLILAVRDGDGTVIEGLSGVLRTRCESESRGTGRWWAERDVTARGSLEDFELVLPWDEGWEDAQLDLSRDGEYVLLCTGGGGAVKLTVLDAASGAAGQELTLFGAAADSQQPLNLADSLKAYHSPSGTVFVLRDYPASQDACVLAAEYSDGEFTPAFTQTVTGGTVKQLFSGETRALYPVDFAYSDGRVAALFTVSWSSGGNVTYHERGCALAVWSENGLEYTARLRPVSWRSEPVYSISEALSLEVRSG